MFHGVLALLILWIRLVTQDESLSLLLFLKTKESNKDGSTHPGFLMSAQYIHTTWNMTEGLRYGKYMFFNNSSYFLLVGKCFRL